MKNDHFFSIFSRFGLFLHVFGEVNEWLILEAHKMIKVLLAVACTVVFILLYGRDWQGRMFKILKNDHFCNILISFGLFSPSFSAG